MFMSLAQPASDPLHAVMDRFRADPRPDKMDLGVGVFRNENGISPTMEAVRQSELTLAEEGGTKAYLPLTGDPAFVQGMTRMVFGSFPLDRVAAIQATGGTGALRLAFELVKLSAPSARVHLGQPSWPSHEGLANATGLELATHDYFDVATGDVDWPSIEAAALNAEAGDLFILHGPCHNPTGADLSPGQRGALMRILAGRGVVPLIDAAYCGLGDGLEEDLGRVRDDLSGFDRALLAVSCSKSFGLYRERTGILFALAANGAEQARVQGQLERISRTLVSMPPAHGAAVVAHILGDAQLSRVWREELDVMRARILAIRQSLSGLANKASALRHVSTGRGIFALLPLSASQTDTLATNFGIHMPRSGRINLTGLKNGDAARFAGALASLCG